MATPANKTTSRANGKELEPPPSAYFLSLTVENVRCFSERQTLDLSDGNDRPRQWTILLGDNGVGKTTLLQCLAGLQCFRFPPVSNTNISSTSELFPRLFPVGLVNISFSSSEEERFTRVSSSVCLDINLASSKTGRRVDEWGIEAMRQAKISSSTSENLRGLICYGYGASRRMGTSELSESQGADTIINLFDDNATLINAEEWLLQADYAAKSLPGRDGEQAANRLERIKEVLKNLLPDVLDIDFKPTKTTPIRMTAQVETHYGWVSIRDMSLGYRTLMTWMVDFASRLFERYPNSANPLAEPAIALIDEIDLHLHPRWQRKLIQDLSETFPNTQFIVSAHSPLVAQAASNANIVLLRREGDHVVIENDAQAIRGWRVDQILTSDLFGLESARPPQFDAAMKERTGLLSKSRLTAKDKARLRELEAEIGSLPTGETPQDIETLDFIRQAAKLIRQQK